MLELLYRHAAIHKYKIEFHRPVDYQELTLVVDADITAPDRDQAVGGAVLPGTDRHH